jgi:hypothetical protein
MAYLLKTLQNDNSSVHTCYNIIRTIYLHIEIKKRRLCLSITVTLRVPKCEIFYLFDSEHKASMDR